AIRVPPPGASADPEHDPLPRPGLSPARAAPRSGRPGEHPGRRGPRLPRPPRSPLGGLSPNASPLALARMVPVSMSPPSIEPLRRCQQVVEGFDGPAAIVWGDRDPILG